MDGESRRPLALVVLAILLVFDGAGGGLGVATAVSRVSGETWGFVFSLAVRLVVSGLALTAASLLLRRLPQGTAMGAIALGGSAVATTIEFGGGYTSSNVFPMAKWSIVIVAWVYAGLWLLYLWRRSQREAGN